MKNIFTKIYLALIILIFLGFTTQLFSQSEKYIKPLKAKSKSDYNKGYKSGFKKGKKIGYAEGFERGIKQGKSYGIMVGKLMGSDSVLAEIKKTDREMYEILIIKNYGLMEKRIKRIESIKEGTYILGYEENVIEAYQMGFREGYETAFDSTMTIKLMAGQYEEYSPRNNANLSIDYEKIAKLLNDINGQNTIVEYSHFSHALNEVHSEVLLYLVLRLGLPPIEQGEVFQRYEEIHTKLAALYYKRYLELCSSKNRNYEKSFYDYRYYTSADIFLDIVGMGISSVADVTFTYAKNNPGFATENGFEVLGHIAELIIDEIFIPLEDYLLKNALILDYNHTLPQVTNITKEILLPKVAETRIHRKIITETVEVSSNYTATIVMEIETIVNVGFYLDDFSIIVDHNKQLFPRQPFRPPKAIGCHKPRL